MASEPEHRCVSENLGRLNDQSHRFPIRRLLSYRTTRHHASPPRIYIYPFATSFLFPRSLKTPFASNDNLVISFQSQTGVVVCIDFSPNLFFPFFFLSSSIDVKYNIKIVSTINRRKVEGGLEATENIIYPFHAAEQSSIVVTNVCKYDRARWLETIFSSLIESPIKLARRVFQNSRYKISRYYLSLLSTSLHNARTRVPRVHRSSSVYPPAGHAGTDVRGSVSLVAHSSSARENWIRVEEKEGRKSLTRRLVQLER